MAKQIENLCKIIASVVKSWDQHKSDKCCITFALNYFFLSKSTKVLNVLRILLGEDQQHQCGIGRGKNLFSVPIFSKWTYIVQLWYLPLSQANDKAVSPVPVWAFTSARASSKYLTSSRCPSVKKCKNKNKEKCQEYNFRYQRKKDWDMWVKINEKLGSKIVQTNFL